MKFFADTAEIADIRELADTGLLDGVTTNPSLVKKSGRDFIEVVTEIADVVSGPGVGRGGRARPCRDDEGGRRACGRSPTISRSRCR